MLKKIWNVITTAMFFIFGLFLLMLGYKTKNVKDIKQREKEVRNEVKNMSDAGLANLANELIRNGSSKR